MMKIVLPISSLLDGGYGSQHNLKYRLLKINFSLETKKKKKRGPFIIKRLRYLEGFIL